MYRCHRAMLSINDLKTAFTPSVMKYSAIGIKTILSVFFTVSSLIQITLKRRRKSKRLRRHQAEHKSGAKQTKVQFCEAGFLQEKKKQKENDIYIYFYCLNNYMNGIRI